jgi:predicted alpha/beta superfamily hydrolase
MKTIYNSLLILFVIGNSFGQQSNSELLVIGKKETLHSTVLNEERILNIYLPENYDSTQSYPVIYLLDGTFNEDFIHIVGLVQFFNLIFKMPETIVVGIANVDRKRDFTFHTDSDEFKKSYPTTGHSAVFIQFIEQELQPYITNRFNTNSTKYLIGQSLGGLLATEILLKKPELFSHYLIVSPSLWWDNQNLLKQAPELINIQSLEKRKVYLSVGGKEHIVMQKDAKKLQSIIKKLPSNSIDLFFNFMKEENHATILHKSIYDAFLNLFPYSE